MKKVPYLKEFWLDSLSCHRFHSKVRQELYIALYRTIDDMGLRLEKKVTT